jgi:polyhydroxyalkanoate synthesis regulator protein
MIVIKRYTNRKLYSTELSRYILMKDIRELEKSAKVFKVIDMKDLKDITKETVLRANYEERLEQLRQEGN